MVLIAIRLKEAKEGGVALALLQLMYLEPARTVKAVALTWVLGGLKCSLLIPPRVVEDRML